MSRRLVIESTGFGVRGAVLADGMLTELIDVDAFGGQVQDLLMAARVTSIDPRLGAAFVDVGLSQPAFLTAKDARHLQGGEERRPIHALLTEGQRLVVQGLREPEAGKGARVTTDLKLAGLHLIWRPHGGSPAAERTSRGAERQALQERGAALFPGKAVTLRKLAARASDEVLRAELAALEVRWQQLAKAPMGVRPGPLAGEPPLERLLQQVASSGLEAIEAADPALIAAVLRLLAGPLAGLGIEPVRLDPAEGAFEQTGVAGELDELTGREVAIGGGARLIVEPTAAGIAIDVDGGAGSALEVDLRAASVLARVVRLRNLGGTILIDFIDLARPQERQRLEEALRRAFRDDPAPVDIYPMSPLGIVQISRARRGRSLDALLTRPCPACAGSGRVPSLRARAEALIGAVARARPPAAAVRVAPDLLAYLQGEAAAAWRAACPALVPAGDAALPAGGFVLGRP